MGHGKSKRIIGDGSLTISNGGSIFIMSKTVRRNRGKGSNVTKIIEDEEQVDRSGGE